MSGCFM